MSETKTVKNTAGYRVNNAVKIWRRMTRKEEEIWLLKELKRKNLGTRNIEEFLGDIRGEKRVRGTQEGKGNNLIKTNKNTKKCKNNKTRK